MAAGFLAYTLAHYHLSCSLLVLAAFLLIPAGAKLLLRRVPTVREADRLNHDAFLGKMAKPAYARVQRSNHRWGLVYAVIIFGLAEPFYLTLDAQPWWRMARDVVMILVLYDLLYYLMHRYLMHDGGPLSAVHALHHRQHNPCRMDSSYIHPAEVALALALFVASNAAVALAVGRLHVAANVAAWIALQRINLFNHHRWLDGGGPARPFGALARMHRNHHVRFTGSNYGQISPLFDWLFGTLDLTVPQRRTMPQQTGARRR